MFWFAMLARIAAIRLASMLTPKPIPDKFGVFPCESLSANIADDLSWAATRALAWSKIRCCWASGMTVWYPVNPGLPLGNRFIWLAMVGAGAE